MARRGSILIVALFVLMLLSVVIGTFAFEMHLEARLASRQRDRFKAIALARSGIAYAKVLVLQDESAFETELDFEDPARTAGYMLSRGVAVHAFEHPLGDGKFVLDIEPEQARRNANQMDDFGWKELFDQTGIPEGRWDSLLGCLRDWLDKNDLHRLNGAESDDPYYEERGYLVKNGPLDSVDELRMIKGFSEAVLYGGISEDGERLSGIAEHLTVFGNDKLNLNSADYKAFMTMPELDETLIDAIMQERLGLDGKAGTFDDGYESLAETGLDKKKFTLKTGLFRIRATGQVSGNEYSIEAVFQTDGKNIEPLQWREDVPTEKDR